MSNKVLIFTDLHIHNYRKFDVDGNRLRNCILVLYDVFNYAAHKEINEIWFVGDLFDQQKSVPTEVLNDTFKAFSDLFYQFRDIHFYAIWCYTTCHPAKSQQH